MGDRPYIAQYYLDKLYQLPELFNELYRQGEYSRAAYVYRRAHIIAFFLELPQEQISELFGQWPDDGDDETVPPPGLFDVDKVREVDWKCCIKQHKTYQDEACRRAKEPQRFYSDDDYCALHCHESREAERLWQMECRKRA